MKVLVVGATGHLGRNITIRLHECGHHVTALARKNSLYKLKDVDVETLSTEQPIDHIAKGIRSYDWIIDAAAPYPLELFVNETFYKEAQVRQKVIIDAAMGGDTGLCYISSFITLPTLAAGAFQTFKRRSSPYYVVKQRLEQQVLAACAEGLRAVILNPGACLGPGDFRPPTLALIPLLINQQLPFVMEVPVNIIDVRDVAALVHRSISSDTTTPMPIPALGHSLKVSDLIAEIQKEVSIESPHLLRTPKSISAIAGFALESLTQVLGMKTPAPALLPFLMTEYVEGAQTNGLTDIRVTVQDSLRWYEEIYR